LTEYPKTSPFDLTGLLSIQLDGRTEIELTPRWNNILVQVDNIASLQVPSKTSYDAILLLSKHSLSHIKLYS
jgi:hypothetical protein